MKSFVVAVALASALLATAPAEARTKKATPHQRKAKSPRSAGKKSARMTTRSDHTTNKPIHQRIAALVRGPASGQSVGVPWAGRLQDPAQLPEGDGYVIRRPWRSFGTRSMVDLVQRTITGVLGEFPDVHVLAIGDISAEHGGQITDHRSHQSGRDIDLGLFYTSKPKGYPENFIGATEDNLDAAATFALVDAFAKTTREDGGAQIMFLDFAVQGMLYRWAKEHDVDEDHLDRLFQFPHGRGASDGLVRHEPNHGNHIHVRFKCPSDDSACH